MKFMQHYCRDIWLSDGEGRYRPANWTISEYQMKGQYIDLLFFFPMNIEIPTVIELQNREPYDCLLCTNATMVFTIFLQ